MTIKEVLGEIAAIGNEYGAESILLFGSRAKGTALERSDIDIAVKGVSNFRAFTEKIDDIRTLYTIDIVNLDRCVNQALLEEIEKYGRQIPCQIEKLQKLT